MAINRPDSARAHSAWRNLITSSPIPTIRAKKQTRKHRCVTSPIWFSKLPRTEADGAAPKKLDTATASTYKQRRLTCQDFRRAKCLRELLRTTTSSGKRIDEPTSSRANLGSA